ncbi:MAG: acetyl-CoA carboxylase carboxyltransferase subunit alpha [Alphaproteobacteria bacterium]|jgi:acetyl-CoA carboxylase carboxyl transferase subunit alpha
MPTFLEFEKPIAELEGKIEELRHREAAGDSDVGGEIEKLKDRAGKLLGQTYAKLTPWQKVQVARHPERPHTIDFIDSLIDDFTLLSGDRTFAEDAAIVAGLGRFRGRSVMVIGNEKGSDTESRLHRNFGMARPEGYRKARRLMELADHFHVPVITLVDTAGAYPGIDAEERGQAEAIARSIEACLRLRVPLISIVVGEGGSGGAIALAAADRILMLEHAIYSVISPEGCASILWRTNDAAKEAAEALRLTAQDLKELKVIDQIIPEPTGGAHRDRALIMETLGDAVEKSLAEIVGIEGGALRAQRREKFMEMGKVGLD